MINIELKDTLTLSDNNDYLVCSKTNYEGNNFLYLVDMNNISNMKICLEKVTNNNISVVEVTDEHLFKNLLYLFIKSTPSK